MTSLDAAAEALAHAFCATLKHGEDAHMRAVIFGYRAGWTAALQSDEVRGLIEALESANKTLRYAQEEYAHGHGIALIGETVATNERALAAFKEKTK